MAEENSETDALGFSFRKTKPTQIPVVVKKPVDDDAPPTIDGIDVDYYRMTSKNRGLALIFNHYTFDHPNYGDRKGTDKDCNMVVKTFTNLGFETCVYQDLKLAQLEDVIYKVSNEDHSDKDCLVVVVMTHGDPDKLHARDEEYHTSLLWERFLGDKCPSLIGKPKLVFIQACRGDCVDEGQLCELQFDGNRQYYPVRIKVPNMADYLVMYSTAPNHFSFRSPERGSWFIQALCEELDKRGQSEDLYSILTAVNRRLAFNFQSNVPTSPRLHEKKQIGQIVSSLTRLVNFSKCQ